MKNFKELLQHFDATLRKYNLTNYQKLQDPLPQLEIEKILDKLHIANVDVKALFEWKNGIDDSKGLGNKDMIFNYGIPFPLESVLDRVINVPHEKTGLIELVGDSSGDGFLFNNETGDDYGRIYIYSVSLLSIDDPYSYFDSLKNMIETTTRAYEQEIFVYDEAERFLNVDYEKFYELATKMNPNSNWWTSEHY